MINLNKDIYFKIFLFTVFIFFFNSCNDSKQISELQDKIVALENKNKMLVEDETYFIERIDELESNNAALQSEINRLRNVNAPSQITSSDVIEVFRDHNSFYCSNITFSNIRVRESQISAVNGKIFDVLYEWTDPRMSSVLSERLNRRNGHSRVTFSNNGSKSVSRWTGSPACM